MASDEEGHSSDERIEEYDEPDSNNACIKEEDYNLCMEIFRV